MNFQEASGLIYADTGVAFDPASGGWPGTLPLSNGAGRSVSAPGII
jgi:hypothetical protein